MTSTRPVERYGAPRPWVRPLLIAAVALLAVAAVGWLLWAAWLHSQPQVSSKLRSYEVVDDRTVSVVFDVRREPGVTATCVLRAQSADFSVVGEISVEIPPGDRENLTLTREIPTERRATNGVLEGCTTPDQQQPR